MYPSSIPGKVVAGIAAITGVILIAMPISLLANNFAATFNFKAKKDRILKVHKARVNRHNQKEKNKKIFIHEVQTTEIAELVGKDTAAKPSFNDEKPSEINEEKPLKIIRAKSKSFNNTITLGSFKKK
jgi:hypothetical protein